MTWTVTRQCQWPDGNNMVEVSAGGIDYTNPDALVAKFAGEFEEFVDPREAAETAIRRLETLDTGEHQAVIPETPPRAIPSAPLRPRRKQNDAPLPLEMKAIQDKEPTLF